MRVASGTRRLPEEFAHDAPDVEKLGKLRRELRCALAPVGLQARKHLRTVQVRDADLALDEQRDGVHVAPVRLHARGANVHGSVAPHDSGGADQACRRR